MSAVGVWPVSRQVKYAWGQVSMKGYDEVGRRRGFYVLATACDREIFVNTYDAVQ